MLTFCDLILYLYAVQSLLRLSRGIATNHLMRLDVLHQPIVGFLGDWRLPLHTTYVVRRAWWWLSGGRSLVVGQPCTDWNHQGLMKEL